MDEEVAEDFEWGRRFVPQICQIVGPRLLVEAPMELDVTEATDMLVFTARDARVACRVRRPGFAERFPYEFTIRSRRANGAATELRKIISGWGDLMFYGHADEADEICRWFLINLDAFRAHLIQDGCRNRRRLWKSEIPNTDRTTWFRPFDVRDFVLSDRVPELLVASSHDIPMRRAA